MPRTNLVSVVMPTAKRPEMLALSLQALASESTASKRTQTSTVSEIDVRIFADIGANLDDLEFVRDTYYPNAAISTAEPHPPVLSGCWNILNAVQRGYETGAGRVILLEEDVLVLPGFFKWHLDIKLQPSVLATCGRWSGFNDKYGPLYTNPGSCLSRPLLDKLIPHINDDYFTHLRSYLDEHFGAWDEMSELDDGLIRRVIHQMGGQALFPAEPVARHIGWRFYNAIDIYMNRETSIEKRIARLREIILSLKPGDRYCADFEF